MRKFIARNCNLAYKMISRLIKGNVILALSGTPKRAKMTLPLINRLIITALCFASLFSFEASAKTDFLSTYKTDLEAVESYLNSISNFSAKFVQKSSGGIVEGKFYLSRPGKMRVEYLNEPKILIVVNGSVLSYKDIELDEVSNISTNTTPASFLTRPNISFAAKDVEITNVVKTDESITISLIKKNRTEAGEFTLTFKTSPALGFAKMQVTNDLGEVTSITLRDVTFPESLSDNLFVIRNKNLPF